MSRMALVEDLMSDEPGRREAAEMVLGHLQGCGYDLQDLPLLPASVIDASVAELRERDVMLYIAQTGSVGSLLSHLWRPSGASKNILGGRFTYAQEETLDFIGYHPEKYCSPEAAQAMAAHAYWHGKKQAYERGRKTVNVVGLGVTASTATGRKRRGFEEVFIAVRTDDGFWWFTARFAKTSEQYLSHLSPQERSWEEKLAVLCGYSLEDCPDVDQSEEVLEAFNQQRRNRRRKDEAEIIDIYALNAVLIVLGIKPIPMHRWHAASPFLQSHRRKVEGEPVQRTMTVSSVDTSRDLVLGDDVIESHLGTMFGPDGSMYRTSFIVDTWMHDMVLFPGSFAPLHHGHIGLAEEIQQQTNRWVVYELSNRNPDKSEIDDDELLRRIDQFRGFARVIATEDAPLFIDKARKYPGIPMVVGADTAVRILDPKYYGGTRSGLFAVLDEFDRLGTYFYVVGREVDDGDGTKVFRTVSELAIPDRYRHLFRDVTFRADVSSTELREARKKTVQSEADASLEPYREVLRAAREAKTEIS